MKALIVMGIRLLVYLPLLDVTGNSMGLTLWFAGHSLSLSLLYVVSVFGAHVSSRPSASSGGDGLAICVLSPHLPLL